MAPAQRGGKTRRRPPVAVIDPGVVLAGFLTADPASPEAKILDLMLAGAFPFALSVDLLAAYRRVVLRKTPRKLHGLSEEAVDVILEELALHGALRQVEPEEGEEEPDPGFLLFDLLKATPGSALVTRDRHESAPRGCEELDPHDFLERLGIRLVEPLEFRPRPGSRRGPRPGR